MRILVELHTHWWWAISTIFLVVGTNFNFVAYTQNLHLKTLGCVDVIRDKLDLSLQYQQKHISGITNALVLVRGNICNIVSGWDPFSFCCLHLDSHLNILSRVDVIRDKLDLDFQHQQKNSNYIIRATTIIWSSLL